jgi:hypothetical protein
VGIKEHTLAIYSRSTRYNPNGYVLSNVIALKENISMADVQASSPPTIKWRTYNNNLHVVVDVFQELHIKVNGRPRGWTIRYPEQAPPGVNYYHIVDEAPPLTPEQSLQELSLKANLKTVWESQIYILNRMLLAASAPHCPNDVTCREYGYRCLEYRWDIGQGIHPFDLEVCLNVAYTHQKDQLALPMNSVDDSIEVKARLLMSVYSNGTTENINLYTVTLPLVEGKADISPFLKGLHTSPLHRAVSNVDALTPHLFDI